MHSFTSAAGSLTTILLATCVLSLPTTTERRFIDLDHNGIPDICFDAGNNDVSCELNSGSWTTIATATPTPTIALTNPPSQSPGSTSNIATGNLPSALDFASQNGTSWTLEHLGYLNYSGVLGTKNLWGDKARSSVIGGKRLWNFGDMECGTGVTECGFSMGPALFDDTGDFTMNTQNINNINDALFVANYSTDGVPEEAGCIGWGMDNSNIAPINDTAGIVYSWEMYRGCQNNPNGINKGVAVSLVTVDGQFPTATRIGSLLTDDSAVQVGLLAILADGGYIYSYTVQGTNVLVGRVNATNDAAFTASNYEFLSSDGTTWVPGIPAAADAGNFNMVTVDQTGWDCGVYGSVIYSNYFNKYMLFCDADELFFNFYVSDTPSGPWSEQYQIIKGVSGYGTMVHPEYSPDGSHKVLYVSQGPNTIFDVWKVTFDYDS